MRAVVQRVKHARVVVGQNVVGEIAAGLLVLLGVEQGDEESDAEYLAKKICELRIFEDDDGKMNRSLIDSGGEMLVVSQFTLLGDCRKGRRPSFVQAAEPETGQRLYQYFVSQVQGCGVVTATGQFRAQMAVELLNDGPVTMLLDSRKTF